jgi:hypothetical protein
MARKIKNPVVVTISKTLADKLVDVLMAGKDGKLANAVCREVEGQAGNWVTLEFARKDALAVHGAALNDIQMGGKHLTLRTYTKIEKAFRDAYDARLRRSIDG